MIRIDTEKDLPVFSRNALAQKIMEEVAIIVARGTSAVAQARSKQLQAIREIIIEKGFPSSREDKKRLSLVPFYFQEANYDDIDWFEKDANLGYLQGIFEIDFALMNQGLKRSASSRRLYKKYVQNSLEPRSQRS